MIIIVYNTDGENTGVEKQNHLLSVRHNQNTLQIGFALYFVQMNWDYPILMTMNYVG